MTAKKEEKKDEEKSEVGKDEKAKKKELSIKDLETAKEKPGDAKREFLTLKDSKAAAELKKGKNVSIITLVNAIVEDAYHAHASDIHIDPEEQSVRARFRIDGVLHDVFVLPKEIQQEVITRIKVLSGLRTDEHQAAQDGRFRVTMPDAQVDIRVSITPTYYGENSVMRLLVSTSGTYTLEKLGFSEENLNKMHAAIKKPYGMILATGPTGSGKTTTLYTILKMLNSPGVAIITIEDPVEYSLAGVEQIQVNPRTNLTFAAGLRSILRQDPDIIMVGEIRDQETAGIAVNAALTGHLLLSTLHTNDAPTTLPRLLDMKIEPFLIASTVNVALGQRLVRQLCDKCKEEQKISAKELESLKGLVKPELLQGSLTVYHGKGCKECDDSGYKGRIGIHEVMLIDDELRAAILRRASAAELKDLAIKNGMTTMIEDGIKKALKGITTLEEILRVVRE